MLCLEFIPQLKQAETHRILALFASPKVTAKAYPDYSLD